MRTIAKNNAKGFAVVLSAALIFGGTAFPEANAKAKKPKLSTTKISLVQGTKKKVTVKNAKKVTWKINKAGKKIVSLSKKSKKGATIKAKKVGKAKITVSMKAGKKTYKKKLTVTVTAKGQSSTTPKSNNATPTPTGTPAASPALSPTPTPTPSATPTPTPSLDTYKMDLDKNAVFEDGNAAEQTMDGNTANVEFGQFQGIFYVLPNTEEMKKANYTHVYITCTSSGSELKVSFLNKETDGNGLEDPIDTYGRQENEYRVEVGAIEGAEKEETIHLTGDCVTNGLQIFNWNEAASLSIKSIILSEKELSKEELAALK